MKIALANAYDVWDDLSRTNLIILLPQSIEVLPIIKKIVHRGVSCRRVGQTQLHSGPMLVEVSIVD